MPWTDLSDETRSRLWGPMHALDEPATLWLLATALALLVLGTIAVEAMRAARLLSHENSRELRRRTWSWWVLAPLMAVPILLGAAPAILAVGLLCAFCYREFARATGLFREHLVSAIVVLGIAALTLAALDHWYAMFMAMFPITIVLLAAVPVVQDRPGGYIQRVGLGILGFALFGACLSYLAYFANDTRYRPILLMLLLCVELNDIFAYCVGRLAGRRKLAPNTSPNKTIGGAAGALILSTALTAWLGHLVFRGSALDHPLPLLSLGLLVSVGAQFGDLVLSSIKRDIGTKDLGALIPGHGGLLDRFDSLVLVAPAVFHFVRFFNGIGLDQPHQVFTSP
jgi:phosphatidate cytidylyltransferase